MTLIAVKHEYTIGLTETDRKQLIELLRVAEGKIDKDDLLIDKFRRTVAFLEGISECF